MLLVGIGISITQPYLSLYFIEDFGMSAGAFGVFMAISSLSGVLVNSRIAKHSDSGLDRKWLKKEWDNYKKGKFVVLASFPFLLLDETKLI